MTVFFTSDTHFGDHRVLNIRPRPFSLIGAMNEALVRHWNARVGSQDEVWHLGDFASGLRVAQQLLPRLNGRKHLVSGNIDSRALRELDGWASVHDYHELMVDGTLLVLCHYPFRTWNRMHRGSLNLHGHSHGRLAPLKRQFDVGVDAQGFRPVLLGELLDKAAVTAGKRQSC